MRNNLINFICSTLLFIATAFFQGWVYYNLYILGITPFLHLFNISLPEIEWFTFSIVPLSINLVRGKSKNEKKYTIFEKEFWKEYIANIVTKIYYVLILMLFNIICF